LVPYNPTKKAGEILWTTASCNKQKTSVFRNPASPLMTRNLYKDTESFKKFTKKQGDILNECMLGINVKDLDEVQVRY
jgi:hypothetical protein